MDNNNKTSNPFDFIVNAYDMQEVKSGRGCSECPNYIQGRDLGYCATHSSSGKEYLHELSKRKRISYSPLFKSLS